MLCFPFSHFFFPAGLKFFAFFGVFSSCVLFQKIPSSHFCYGILGNHRHFLPRRLKVWRFFSFRRHQPIRHNGQNVWVNLPFLSDKASEKGVFGYVRAKTVPLVGNFRAGVTARGMASSGGVAVNADMSGNQAIVITG